MKRKERTGRSSCKEEWGNINMAKQENADISLKYKKDGTKFFNDTCSDHNWFYSPHKIEDKVCFLSDQHLKSKLIKKNPTNFHSWLFRCYAFSKTTRSTRRKSKTRLSLLFLWNSLTNVILKKHAQQNLRRLLIHPGLVLGQSTVIFRNLVCHVKNSNIRTPVHHFPLSSSPTKRNQQTFQRGINQPRIHTSTATTLSF